MRLHPIGTVLRELQQEFPELTVSKLRFLETEGLVLPQRRESGQRAYTDEDIERLRFVLRAQRDRFWPLKVIKAALDRMDLGLDQDGWETDRYADSQDPGTGSPEPSGQSGAGPAEGSTPVGEDATGGLPSRLPSAAQLRRRRAIRLTAEELREHSALDLAGYTQLKAFGLIRTDGNGRHGADDLDVARECTALAAYGLEPRHLRLFRVAAEREIGLAQQILEPVRRRRARGAQDADPEQLEAEILARTLALHVALVRAGLGHTP